MERPRQLTGRGLTPNDFLARWVDKPVNPLRDHGKHLAQPSCVHRALMTDSRTIDDDVLRDVVMRAGGDWLRAMTWLAAHADAVAARLRANGQEAYSIGLAGTPGYLAGPMLVMGAIDASDFQRLFARAREES